MPQIVISRRPEGSTLGTALSGIGQALADIYADRDRRRLEERENERYEHQRKLQDERHQVFMEDSELRRKALQRDEVDKEVSRIKTQAQETPYLDAPREMIEGMGPGVSADPELGIPEGPPEPYVLGPGNPIDHVMVEGRRVPLQWKMPGEDMAAQGAKVQEGLSTGVLRRVPEGMPWTSERQEAAFPVGSIQPTAGIQAELLKKPELTLDQEAHRARVLARAASRGREEGKPVNPSDIDPSVAGVVPRQHQDLHGEDYLKTLDPAEANSIKAVAEGRTSVKNASLRRYKDDSMSNRRKLTLQVLQYDPEWDENVFSARQKVRKDFADSSTAPGRAINASNTLIRHLNQLYNSISGLNNTDFKILNSAWQKGLQQIGDPRLNKFLVSANGAASELATIFKSGNAAPSKEEIAEARQTFNPFQSPDQLLATIRASAEAMRGRLDTHALQWEDVMGTPHPTRFLNRKSIESLQAMGMGDIVGLAGGELDIAGEMFITEEEY